MHIANRLKSERERLGYSQGDFAAVVDATRKTVFNWESGSGSPSAEVLAAWADVGLDVLYVVTGNRSFAPPPKYSAKAQLLIEYFEQAPESIQKKLLRIALDDEHSIAAPNTPKRRSEAGAGHSNSGADAVQIGGDATGAAINTGSTSNEEKTTVKSKGGWGKVTVGKISINRS